MKWGLGKSEDVVMVSDSIGNGSVAPNDTRLLLSFVATIFVGNGAALSSFVDLFDASSTVSGKVKSQFRVLRNVLWYR